MLFKKIITTTIAIFLVSCANQQAPKTLSSELQKEYETPLLCTQNTCDKMWERGTFFISQNTGFKIQVHNNMIVETWNSTGSSTGLAFKMTKEPLPDGAYRIWTTSQCGHSLYCDKDPIATVAKAKWYMRHGVLYKGADYTTTSPENAKKTCSEQIQYTSSGGTYKSAECN
ncbi:hypothetical protein DS893_04750 [Vibrionales bacterium C3R12]|nr:hypothetical protein DS893_04750 [Vibrionales bacterium C3R12]